MNNNSQYSGVRDKRIVILGGTSGIGRATAIAAAAAGGKVVVVSSKKKNVDATVAELGSGHEGFVTNLSDEQSIRNLFEEIGSFDHLVFTAGDALMIGSLPTISIDDAKEFFNIRYWGAVTSVKYASPHINKGGSIILTGGGAGHRPGAGWSIAASICAAMEGFTRAAALDLAPLRVNLVAPGLVRTNLWSSFTDSEREKMFAYFGGALPVGHVGEAEEIANTYLYLMTQTYSTGQCIVVDGGGGLV